MILRRPYAFLIKHFRFIHLILFSLMVYITVMANNILKFFTEYIANNGNIEVIAVNYINSFIIISIILIIILSIVVYLLMRFKKKPRLLYILIILVSIISAILFVYLYSNIKVLETSAMSARNIRLLRDISRFNYWGLFILCIPLLIRGLGFDIKKFNFSKDIKDLKLDTKDNEEVEVNIDLSSDGIKRGGHKLRRELKYYYIENKFMLNIIFGIILLILIIIFPFNKYVINKTLTEGNTLSTKNFNIKVNDSYISERKQTSKNNSYLIIDISLKGKNNNYKLNLDNFILEGKNNEYIPSLKYYYYFTDLGNGYYNNILNTKDYEEYILIYNIDNIDKDSNFRLRYLENNRYIKLKPETIK